MRFRPAYIPIGALLGIAVGAYNLFGPFWPTSPDVHPGSEKSSPEFIAPIAVRNLSTVFPMKIRSLECHIMRAMFQSPDKPWRAIIVVSSGPGLGDATEKPIAIRPKGLARFPCSASNGIRQPQIAINGQTIELTKLKGFSIYIGVQFATDLILFDWERSYSSTMFTLIDTPDGMQWVEGEVIQ